MEDTQGNRVHVYVDTQNCTVISIWPQPKRLPVESPRSRNDQPGRRLRGRGRVYGQMGTSPFQSASQLFIEITPVDFKAAPWEEHPGPRTTISGMIQMVEYHDGISCWYYAVNTTSLLPYRYEIWVWSNPDDPYWEGVSTEFTLSGWQSGMMGAVHEGEFSNRCSRSPGNSPCHPSFREKILIRAEDCYL